jgi:hypothetical protein
MYERHAHPVLPFRRFLVRFARHAGLVVAVVVASVLFGTAGYRALGPMSWIDAFLNASMLTSGMGEVAPLTNTPVKIFASFYALFSGLVSMVSVTILMAPVVHRVLHRLQEER